MNPKAKHKSQLLEMFNSTLENRNLIFQLTKSEVIAVQCWGLHGYFFNLLIILAVYALILSNGI